MVHDSHTTQPDPCFCVRNLLVIMAFLMAWAWVGAPAWAETKTGPAESTKTPGRAYAVVIGIDEYEYMGELSGATRDALAMKNALEAQDFEVLALLNEDANRQRIWEELTHKIAPRLNPEDRVLVYFAGHGVSKTGGANTRGYLVPADANPDKHWELISMQIMVEEIFDTLPAEQILYLADACHAGLAHESRSGGTDRVRVVMTAGTDGQQVLDNHNGHGLYTYYLLKGIEGAADINDDGLVKSSELHAFVKGNVELVAQSMGNEQTPQSSQVGSGDFTFYVGGHSDMVASTDQTAQSAMRGENTELAYFGGWAWNRGVMQGVQPLTKEQAARREYVYEFTSKRGLVQTVRRLNHAGYPTALSYTQDSIDDGVMEWIHMYGSDGQTVAEVVEIGTLGHVVRRRQYSGPGAERVDFKDKYGQFTQSRLKTSEIGVVKTELGPSVYGTVFEYDTNGYISKERYIGMDPFEVTPRSDHSGNWGYGYKRDANGRVLEHWPLSQTGERTRWSSGIAGKRFSYHTNGCRRFSSFVNHNGERVRGPLGYAILHTECDDVGNEVRSDRLSRDWKLISNNKFTPRGMHNKQPPTTIFEYDNRGAWLMTRNLDANAEPSVDAYGISIRRMKYDGRGNWLETAFYDAKGQPAVLKKPSNEWQMDADSQLTEAGVSIRRWKYDARGNQIEKSLYGATGQPVTNEAGVSIWRWKYDSRGYRIELSYFDAKRKPIHHIIRKQYDVHGNRIDYQRFGIDGKPIADQNGVWSSRAKRDARGNRILYQNLGIDGALVDSLETGWAQKKYKYNQHNMMVEATTYSADGKAVPANGNNYATVRWSYDAKQRVREYAYLDQFGELTNTKYGYARSVHRYNKAGQRLLQTDQYDSNGRRLVSEYAFDAGERWADEQVDWAAMKELSARMGRFFVYLLVCLLLFRMVIRKRT